MSYRHKVLKNYYQSLQDHLPHGKCDPYQYPGKLNNNYEWLDNGVSGFSPTNSLSLLSHSPHLPAHLQNKFVLLYGDSQDRKIVHEACEITNGTLSFVTINGKITLLPKHGDCRVCVIRKNDHVFVIMSVFNIGVLAQDFNDEYGWPGHVSPGEPFRVQERVAKIPMILSLIAFQLFPELCGSDMMYCYDGKQKVAPLSYHENLNMKYPSPDMIIAQATLWDMKNFDEKMVNILDSDQFTMQFINPWKDYTREYLLNALQKTFLSVENKYEQVPKCSHVGKIVKHRWFVRTTPSVSDAFNSNIISILNNIYRQKTMRSGNRSHEWGVMDWDLLVGSRKMLQDGIHQNKQSMAAMLQMVLVRLEINAI